LEARKRPELTQERRWGIDAKQLEAINMTRYMRSSGHLAITAFAVVSAGLLSRPILAAPDYHPITPTMADRTVTLTGHDLTIDAVRWSGELAVGDDLTPTSLEVRIDMGSLVVREGSGGIKPLTDRDKREIQVTARKVLGSDRHPEARFSATSFEPAGDGGVISGTMTIAGKSSPVRLTVTKSGPDSYQATTSVVQTAFGITPYRGFFGALKVRDAVDIQAELSLPGEDPAEASP